MIKIFTDEMRELGVSRFEKSEIGTLHRLEGESIALTCIMGYRGFVSSDVEKRIIDKIHKFVSLVESELTTELNLWSENLIDSQRFEEKLFKLLTSAIKLKGLEKIEKSKIKWLRKQRPKLKKKLEELYTNMEKYNTRFKKGKRSYPEYEERKRREWYYYKAKKELTYTILSLSQIPPYTTEPNDKEIVKELERLRNRFYELWCELNEAYRKKTLTYHEPKERRQKEQELFTIIKTLDNYMYEYLSAINVISN
ncbi:MAG: hypothetical protein ACETWM_22655 [Candidatus Lokiarchaeia archaeon]